MRRERERRAKQNAMRTRSESADSFFRFASDGLMCNLGIIFSYMLRFIWFYIIISNASESC